MHASVLNAHLHASFFVSCHIVWADEKGHLNCRGFIRSLKRAEQGQIPPGLHLLPSPGGASTADVNGNTHRSTDNSGREWEWSSNKITVDF